MQVRHLKHIVFTPIVRCNLIGCLRPEIARHIINTLAISSKNDVEVHESVTWQMKMGTKWMGHFPFLELFFTLSGIMPGACLAFELLRFLIMQTYTCSLKQDIRVSLIVFSTGFSSSKFHSWLAFFWGGGLFFKSWKLT